MGIESIDEPALHALYEQVFRRRTVRVFYVMWGPLDAGDDGDDDHCATSASRPEIRAADRSVIYRLCEAFWATADASRAAPTVLTQARAARREYDEIVIISRATWGSPN